MKFKKLVFIVLSTSLLASCGKNDSSSVDQNVEVFNSTINYDYSSFKISITTSLNDLKLDSVYIVTKSNDNYEVQYSVEKYNTFDLTSDTYPSSIKTTETGSYTTDKVKYDLKRFAFSENIFDSYSFEEGILEGSIQNGKNYLNVNYDCLNLNVRFEYSTMLTKIQLSYSLEDSTGVKVVIEDFK